MMKYFSKGGLYPGLFHGIFEVSRVSLRKWDNLGDIHLPGDSAAYDLSWSLSQLEVTTVPTLWVRVTWSQLIIPKIGHKLAELPGLQVFLCGWFWFTTRICTRKLITMKNAPENFGGVCFFLLCVQLFSPKRIMVEIAKPKFHDPTDSGGIQPTFKCQYRWLLEPETSICLNSEMVVSINGVSWFP